MKCFALCTLVFALCLPVLAAAKERGKRFVRNVSYIENGHAKQKLDIYRPKGEGPWPVLVFVHGGGWKIGDKRNRSARAGFVEKGYLIVVPNYRLSPEVQHPAHAKDVAASLAWVYEHIEGYGGDTQKIFVSGHSAGAHLAALMGADPRWLAAHKRDAQNLAGVILLDGAGYDIPLHMQKQQGFVSKMFTEAFGSEEAGQRDASPALTIPEEGFTPPPFLIFHIASRAKSQAQSQLLAKALRKAGGKALVISAANETHTSIHQGWGKENDPETKQTLSFMADPLKFVEEADGVISE